MDHGVRGYGSWWQQAAQDRGEEMAESGESSDGKCGEQVKQEIQEP
jgi:hypothetical protein